MIERKILNKKTSADIDAYLMRFEVYSIESIIDKNTRYVASQDRFAIIRNEDAMVCDLEEITQMAAMFKKKIKQEILDIYDDLKDFKNREIEYWKVER